MKISIIQPLYIPWFGFFEMVSSTDAYVVLDHVKFQRSSWQQRNRIKGSNGPFLITVPVMKPGNGNDRICEREIDYREPWVRKHLKSLELSYRRAPYFERYFQGFRNILENRFDSIADLNLELIKTILRFLGIEKKIIRSSELPLGDDRSLGKNERLIRVMKVVGADTFYEGASGANFIDVSLFESQGLKVSFQKYDHPVYRQIHGSFTPYMSTVDLLFNCGERALDIIRSGARN